MKQNIVKEKSFQFAVRVVSLYKTLYYQRKEFVMSRQLLRSGTSIGAMVRESVHAESKNDFIHKLSIALKEANETEYWILLLRESGFLSVEETRSIQADIESLLKLLTSILNTTKQHLTR